MEDVPDLKMEDVLDLKMEDVPDLKMEDVPDLKMDDPDNLEGKTEAETGAGSVRTIRDPGTTHNWTH